MFVHCWCFCWCDWHRCWNLNELSILWRWWLRAVLALGGQICVCMTCVCDFVYVMVYWYQSALWEVSIYFTATHIIYRGIYVYIIYTNIYTPIDDMCCGKIYWYLPKWVYIFVYRWYVLRYQGALWQVSIYFCVFFDMCACMWVYLYVCTECAQW